MKENELNDLLKNKGNLEYHQDKDHYYFRNNCLPWYANNPEHCTRIKKTILEKLAQEQLLKEINQGLEVEGITRITGYYTKTAKWNKGKLGELRDRTRYEKL